MPIIPINTDVWPRRAPCGGPGRLLLMEIPPPKNRMRWRAFSLGTTGHDWGPLGTAGIAGMPPPPFVLGSCPPLGGVGAGMAGAFSDCIPKGLPPGDIPTPKGVDRHPQPAREGQGPGNSRHRGPEAGGPGRPGTPGQPRPGLRFPSSPRHMTSPGEVPAGRPMAVRHPGR